MSELTKKNCTPGLPALDLHKLPDYTKEVPDWAVTSTVTETKRLHREFKFKDFRQSIEFVKKVADLAEKENHHPNIFIFFNVVKLDLWTHDSGGITENDFIVAAKIDQLAE